MSVTVVIPFSGSCPHRLRALRWATARYDVEHLDWRVVVARVPADRPWCKADAVMPAIEAARSDVVVVADADVWTEGLVSAVRAVTCGAARWAMPHDLVIRLTEDASATYTATREVGETISVRHGVRGGGIVVATPEALLEAPLDPRFVGWGQEDASWARALVTLHGSPWRGDADLIHLFHPPQPRMLRKYGSQEGQALWRRYAGATGDERAIRALIGEFDEHRRLWERAAGSEPAQDARSAVDRAEPPRGRRQPGRALRHDLARDPGSDGVVVEQ